MLKFFCRTAKDRGLKEKKTLQPGCWIYLVRPSRDELEAVIAKAGLSPDLLKDALDPFEGPRLETVNDTTYIFTRVPLQKANQETTQPLLIAIGQEFITTLSKEKTNIFEPFLSGEMKFSTNKRIKFFVKIFSEINEQFSDRLVDISKRVRRSLVELQKVKDKDIVQFVYFENLINEYLAALVPTNALLHTMLSGRHLKMLKSDIDSVQDLFLGTNQLIEISHSTLKNIVNIRDAYSTIINQDTNKIVKLLTLITILLTVPTMIASFFGMNLQIPLAQSPVGFHIVVLVALSAVAVVLTIFLKRRWF